MIPLVYIGLVTVVIVTIVIASLVLINGFISSQQELAEINHIQQKQNETSTEINSIKLDDTIKYSKSHKKGPHIIQIRIHYEYGDGIESFSVRYSLHGDGSLITHYLNIIPIQNPVKYPNSHNNEIHIVQLEVYDTEKFVESFDVDYIIQYNGLLKITSLPIPLQEMLFQLHQ